MSAAFVPVWSPRPDWSAAPAVIADWVCAELRAPVVSATGHVGGFSSGIAATVRTAAGRSAFVKAVHPELNPLTPDRHRHEVLVNRLLPAGAPTPRLHADLDVDGWVGLLFDAVDGAPPRWPWRPAELAATLTALRALRAALTPIAPTAQIRPAAELLTQDAAACTRLLADRPASLDAWTARNLPALAELAAALDPSGATLLNLDIRADNVVIDRVGAAWIVDWSWGCVGAAFLDALPLLVNVAAAGLDPQAWLLRSTAADAEPAQVDAFLAVLIGMWAEGVGRPPPAGTAGMREFQLAHLRAAQSWLHLRRPQLR